MNRTIRILFTAILCFLGMVSIAQETPPSGLKPVNAQFYIHLPDSSIWHNKGVPYGWERLARYIDVPTLTSIIRNQNASAQSANFWINGNGKAYTFTAYGDSNTYSTFTPGGFTNFLSFDGGSTYDDGFIGATGLHIKRGLSYMSFNPRSGQDLVDVSGNFIFGDLVKTSILSNNFSISGATDNNSINSTFGLVDSHGDPLPRINFNVSNNNTGTSGQVSINDAGVNFSGAGGQLNIDNSGVVVSDNTGKGAVYGGDYEAGFVDRSLVTKQYVTGSYLAKADTATLARKNGNSSITNLNYKANGTAGNGYIEIKSQTVSPSSSTGAIRLYADSLNRLSWKNSTYRRTLRVNRPLDQTITFPWKQNPTLADSSEVANAYYTKANADTNYVARTAANPQISTVKLTSTSTGATVWGTTPNVLNTNGTQYHTVNETSYLSNRPVGVGYNFLANPTQAFSGPTDEHGVEFVSSSGSQYMTSGRLYTGEFSAISNTGVGKQMLGAFGVYSQIDNNGAGGIYEAVSYRSRLQNLGSGTINSYKAFRVEKNVNSGGGAITNSYGYYVEPDVDTYGAYFANGLNYARKMTIDTATLNQVQINGALSVGVAPGTAYKAQFLSTTLPQLALSYGASNQTTFNQSSSGNLTVTPSGGVFGIAGTLQGTSLQVLSANANFYSPSSVAASAFGSPFAFLGNTSQYGRTAMGSTGAQSTTIPNGANYFNVMVAPSNYTVATGTAVQSAANFVVRPFGTVSGAGTTTNAYTMVVDGDPTNGTATNIALWINGKFKANSVISSILAPSNTYQTATGTAGTDSLVVKNAGALRAIAANYYAPVANPSFTGTVNMQGIRLGYKAVTAATTFGAGDFGVNITSGTFTQALPNTPNFGMVYAINNTGTGVITVTATSIAGLTSVILSPGEWIMVQYTGVSGTYTILSSSVNSPKSLRLTGSGTGAATTISIPHGLTGVTAASIVTVQPINAASQGVQYVTADATNINIVYSAAPVVGTNNLSYNVIIKP